ncbi:MAG: class I SAM-dependent methyltransferase, partial [Lachnospiraceae bacterium]|nr:class I SAM-dependent methyltransferase [Lachnospiraceae bacterium]
MQLSKRMQRLASLVTEENRLADIGTDHGYIPIYLIQQKKIQSALAMDINSGPLSRAKEHIEASGLTTYIETRLSDGLCKLEADEADTVLIAGMGGMLMVSILN